MFENKVGIIKQLARLKAEGFCLFDATNLWLLYWTFHMFVNVFNPFPFELRLFLYFFPKTQVSTEQDHLKLGLVTNINRLEKSFNFYKQLSFGVR